MSLPIIFIHQGNSSSLLYTLWQAQQTNPNSRIILLGDWANVHYRWLLGIEHYPIESYTTDAHHALKNYIHMSTNGESFEWFCIARWFILHQFLNAQPEIDRCVYLDSDVLVYDSLELPANKLSRFGMTMVSYSAHTNFINDIKFLGEFCSFVQRHYDEAELRLWLHDHYNKFIDVADAGGISDMTFFHKFRSENPDRVGTLVDPIGQDEQVYTFDERLDSEAGGYELKDGLKNIFWINRVPYCKHLSTNKLVKFYTLHFQGKLKSKIKYYLSFGFRQPLLKETINNSILVLGKIVRKFSVFKSDK